MTERSLIPFTNEHFAAFCVSMLGQPYWYGTCIYKCTGDLLASKSRQYPSSYTPERIPRYEEDIRKWKVCADCVGGCKGYAWTDGGQGVLESIGKPGAIPSKYESNGCPDLSANGMFRYAQEQGMDWGDIRSLPEIPGLALHRDGHMGFYVGNGYAVEWRGFAYGCVRTRVASRNWQHWYKLPFIRYEGDPPVSGEDQPLGSRLLRRGMRGEDVKSLQRILMKLGYPLPRFGADGVFGEETEQALKSFQRASGLEADGIYGTKTHQALMEASADWDGPTQDDPLEPLPERQTVLIRSSGSLVNIRSGNGTGYSRISQVPPGTVLPYVATARNGWNAVEIGDRVGWVSGNYSSLRQGNSFPFVF